LFKMFKTAPNPLRTYKKRCLKLCLKLVDFLWKMFKTFKKSLFIVQMFKTLSKTMFKTKAPPRLCRGAFIIAVIVFMHKLSIR
jgi:hypothetical protein